MRKRKLNINLPLMSAVCLAAIVLMILALSRTGSAESTKFTPPPFEENAQSGMPDTEDESYTKVYQEGMSFTAYVCGEVCISDRSADLYFTSDAKNTVWLKLRITDDNGRVLGETGLLMPGEYVKSVSFDTVPANGEKIKLKIMAYMPDTYYSAGAVTLNTTVVS